MRTRERECAKRAEQTIFFERELEELTSPFRDSILVEKVVPLALLGVSEDVGDQTQPREPILDLLVVRVLVGTVDSFGGSARAPQSRERETEVLELNWSSRERLR